MIKSSILYKQKVLLMSHSGSRNMWNTNFFFLWDIIFMSGVTGYASHSGAWSGFQWVIGPLSGHVYSVLTSRGGQSRNSALHRIELQTSRSTIQHLQPLNHVVVIISVQMMVYMPLNMWKYHRNRNLKISKNWLFQVSNPGLRGHWLGCPTP